MRVFLISLLAVVAVIELIWLRLSHFHVDARSYAIILAMFSIFMVASLFYRYIRKDVSVSGMLFGLGFLFALGSSLNIINYMGLTVLGPRIDDILATADRAMGVDWPALMLFMSRHNRLNFVLLVAYHYSIWQTAALIVVLGWKDRAGTIERLCLSLAICGLLTVGIWTAFPSFGAITVYGLPATVAAKLPISVDLNYAHELLKLWVNGPELISPQSVRGLVGFPSFHTAESVIATWYARRSKFLFYPFLIFNALAILSTPIQGGHHVVDVIGGFAVAALAILATTAIARRLTTSEAAIAPMPTFASAG